MPLKKYGNSFFNLLSDGSYKSAQSVLPLISELLRPKSVVDVGCGTGAWLKVFQELGVEEILGIEGEYIKKQKTYIPKANFLYHNLEEDLKIDRRFELAISLEVGEHISERAAPTLVNVLCRLSDIIMFSAAVTGQEGTMHINEQFPEYWASLFMEKNYVPIDFVRQKIWNNKNIEVWYRQNILLYVRKEILMSLPETLIACQKETHANYLFRIHPDLYLEMLKRKYPFYFINYWWNRFKRSFKEY